MSAAYAWRPRNETAADLEHELHAAARIEAWAGATSVKLSESLYHVDWAFFRNEELVAWGEYKRRAQRFPTLLLGVAKWRAGRALAKDTGVPFLLFVEWPDGLHYCDTQEMMFPIKRGGNTRGQNGDIEPTYHIPVELFRRI